ncbi:uncharacterized protein LOC126475262 [Schistocerca serialis cubense]|uniref:uncharacterized protein LOC126475262 n=1 Tax=Schistocerca serialis cubense TaxID=2023355 RepID=UPI00214F5B9B|nr:uncharacterized protein LOC126475262 [Schistocerca serialis cubense]
MDEPPRWYLLPDREHRWGTHLQSQPSLYQLLWVPSPVVPMEIDDSPPPPSPTPPFPPAADVTCTGTCPAARNGVRERPIPRRSSRHSRRSCCCPATYSVYVSGCKHA